MPSKKKSQAKTVVADASEISDVDVVETPVNEAALGHSVAATEVMMLEEVAMQDAATLVTAVVEPTEPALEQAAVVEHILIDKPDDTPMYGENEGESFADTPTALPQEIPNPVRLPLDNKFEPKLPIHDPLDVWTAMETIRMLAETGMDEARAQALITVSQMRNIRELVEHDTVVTNSLIFALEKSGVLLTFTKYFNPGESQDHKMPFSVGGKYSRDQLQHGVLLLSNMLDRTKAEAGASANRIQGLTSENEFLVAQSKKLKADIQVLKQIPPPPSISGAHIVLMRRFEVEDKPVELRYLGLRDDDDYFETSDVNKASRFINVFNAVDYHIKACHNAEIDLVDTFMPISLLYQEVSTGNVHHSILEEYTKVKGMVKLLRDQTDKRKAAKAALPISSKPKIKPKLKLKIKAEDTKEESKPKKPLKFKI